MKELRIKRALTDHDILIQIFMSHGGNQNLPGSYTEVFGIDGQGISTESIINEFTGDKCPSMNGKPKIFIFQCCR